VLLRRAFPEAEIVTAVQAFIVLVHPQPVPCRQSRLGGAVLVGGVTPSRTRDRWENNSRPTTDDVRCGPCARAAPTNFSLSGAGIAIEPASVGLRFHPRGTRIHPQTKKPSPTCLGMAQTNYPNNKMSTKLMDLLLIYLYYFELMNLLLVCPYYL